MSETNPNITDGANPAPPAPAATAPPKPAAAPAPKPAAAAAKPAAKGKQRRFFLVTIFTSWFAGAWAAFIASMGVMTLGTLRFLYPNVLSEPPSKIKVGIPGQLRGRQGGRAATRTRNTWVVRKDGVDLRPQHHLHPPPGCTPPTGWSLEEQKFKCPCHGSGYFISGVNFEGPAPRPLGQHGRSASATTAEIVVDKSRSFHAGAAASGATPGFLLPSRCDPKMWVRGPILTWHCQDRNPDRYELRTRRPRCVLADP